MPILRWLHLTDLHFGDPHIKSLWLDNIEAAFVADLKLLAAELGGPLDLLLFTGDLVYSGSADQFKRFEAWLQRLYGHLERLGLGAPLLLAVPGNHDLMRPDAGEAQRLIDGWHDGTRGHTAQPLLTSAFAAYTDWWGRHAESLAPYKAGLLAGDFSITVEKDGYKLGIIGLNSAFLQLVGGELQGKLALSEEQLSAVCSDAVNDWVERHHLTMLLTHHPPSWLRDRERYESELAPPGRFAVHLCGHMHIPESHADGKGEGPLRRLWQGASLFGLDRLDGKEVREHGYTLGVLNFSGAEAQLYQLPRRAPRQQNGSRTFSADPSYRLVGNTNHTPAVTFALAAPPPAGPSLLEAPGGAYNPASYVHRPHEEGEVLGYLDAGVPLLLAGPAHIGKSTFVSHMLAVLEQQPFWQGGRVYEVPGSQLAGDSLNAVLDNFAGWLCQSDDKLEAVLREATNNQLTKQRQIDKFFSRGILEPARGPILLLLDNADSIITKSYTVDFVSLLRVWVERTKGLLRVVLTASTSRSYHPIERSAFADRFQIIELHDFDESAVRTIARKYLPTVQEAELVALRQQTGGHPYFVRSYLYHAALHSLSLTAALADRKLEQQLLTKIGAMLGGIPPNVLDEVTACFFGSRRAEISPEIRRWLRFAGLLSDDEQRLRCRIYERFFRERPGR